MKRFFQRGPIYGDRPRSRGGAASGELPRQTSFPAEEPLPAAHGAQVAAAQDRHTVRGGGGGVQSQYAAGICTREKNESFFFFFPSGVISYAGYPPFHALTLKWIFLQHKVNASWSASAAASFMTH